MLISVKRNISYPAILILSLSLLTAAIILYGSNKVIAAFSLLLAMPIFYISAPPFAKIVLPMIMITFPVTLQVFGNDAFSTGTLLIFVTFAWALSKHKLRATLTNDRNLFRLLSLLAGIGLIGMATKTPGAYWGPAVRSYLNFISSVAFFFLIIHSQNIMGISGSKKEYIEKLISVLLLITVAHIFLCFFIFNYPGIEKYFTVFLRRTQEHFSGDMLGGHYVRGTTIFTGGEEFGELLILLFPFVLYRLFTTPKKLYWFVAASFLLGLGLSATRSALFLMIFQGLAFIYFLVPGKYNRKKIAFTISFGLVFMLLLPVFLKYDLFLMDRVQDMLDQIGRKADIISVVNRSGVWQLAWEVTIKTVSMVGHGPIQAYKIGFPGENFHCLYLSLLFQFGVIGLVLFIILFFVMAKRLFIVAKNIKRENDSVYLLALSCLLSLFCFLVNEIKFEFNRGDSYQQFVWGIFAVYYLTGTLNKHSF